jgi:hypothetical protein
MNSGRVCANSGSNCASSSSREVVREDRLELSLAVSLVMAAFCSTKSKSGDHTQTCPRKKGRVNVVLVLFFITVHAQELLKPRNKARF